MTDIIQNLTKVEKFVASFAIGLLAIFVLSDVILREVFSLGFPVLLKSSVVLMNLAGYLGVTVIATKSAHLRPKVADKLWEKHPQVFTRIQNLILLAFNLIMLYASVSYVMESFEFGDQHVVLKLPLWVLQLMIPYCFFSMGLKSLLFLISPKLYSEFYQEEMH